MHVMSIAKFERFFRTTAGLDIDKQDLKRFGDFINRKLYDLLSRGEAIARANGRNQIEPIDLPITKGLQAQIDEFSKLDEDLDQASMAAIRCYAKLCLFKGAQDGNRKFEEEKDRNPRHRRV